MAEYIERDKAVEKINAYCELRQAICLNDKDEFLRGLQTALKAISYNDVIPNADVQPVRRGRWIEHHDLIRCSVCGFEVKDEYHEKRDMTSTETSYDFCPKCGAKIKEG